MNKRRISTNISQKHWELLKKWEEKYGTQQKTLEVALENLENNSKKSPELNMEEKALMSLIKYKKVVVFGKDAFKLLIENANIEPLQKYFIQHRGIEFGIEFLFQKPLKEISLEEFVYGFVVNARYINWLDTVECKDEGSHYTLVMTHSFSPKVSKSLVTVFENMLRNYGVDFQIAVSSMTIFIKIFKN
jgi:hypothetical protein